MSVNRQSADAAVRMMVRFVIAGVPPIRIDSLVIGVQPGHSMKPRQRMFSCRKRPMTGRSKCHKRLKGSLMGAAGSSIMQGHKASCIAPHVASEE